MSKQAEQALIEKYRKRLPTKVNELQDLVAARDVANTRSQLHKLAGSAGMYGLESISLLAAQLEDIIVEQQSVSSSSFQTLFEALCAKVSESQLG